MGESSSLFLSGKGEERMIILVTVSVGGKNVERSREPYGPKGLGLNRGVGKTDGVFHRGQMDVPSFHGYTHTLHKWVWISWGGNGSNSAFRRVTFGSDQK
jgi:hypothetical protein